MAEPALSRPLICRSGERSSISAMELPPRELVEPFLHGGKLGLQTGDLVIAARRLGGVFYGGAGWVVVLVFAGRHPRERAEQAKRALESGKVLTHLLLHGLKGRRAERMGETAAILLLLPGKRIEAKLKIARHQPLHAVAIEADQLTQEPDGKEIRSSAFLLDDDLGQHRVRKIFAGLGIID